MVVLSHIKFGDCKINVVPLPIDIWLLDNVVVPIHPRVIENVPDDTLKAFKEFKEAPEPWKREAVIFVADIVVPENNDNVEDIDVPTCR